MFSALIQKMTLPAFAALAAAGGGLIAAASGEPEPAYGYEARAMEASAAAQSAEIVFEKADLNNDGGIDRDEYVTLAIVNAELFRLNGFVAIETADGVEKVAIAAPAKAALTEDEKRTIRARSSLEYDRLAGYDHKLTQRDFVDSKLEEFFAADVDRNGVLTGAELERFAFNQSRIGVLIG